MGMARRGLSCSLRPCLVRSHWVLAQRRKSKGPVTRSKAKQIIDDMDIDTESEVDEHSNYEVCPSSPYLPSHFQLPFSNQSDPVSSRFIPSPKATLSPREPSVTPPPAGLFGTKASHHFRCIQFPFSFRIGSHYHLMMKFLTQMSIAGHAGILKLTRKTIIKLSSVMVVM